MLTVAEAKQVAQQLYGIQGATTKLPGEYDSNFHLKASDGNQFILKISHPQEAIAMVEMQNAALNWIQAATHTLRCPTLHPTVNGHTVASEADRLVRLFNYVPGKLFSEIKFHSPALLTSLGEQLGHLTQTLIHFKHPAAKRQHKWDMQQSGWALQQVQQINDASDREMVSHYLTRFNSHAAVQLPTLRQSVIHGDLNDYNILVTCNALGDDKVSGFIDFGDLVETATLCELAIALAYVMLDKPDPLAAAQLVIQGFHDVYPLQENEVAILFDLICQRLCMSVINSAIRKQEHPNNHYLTISEAPAWELLKKLQHIHPRFAHYAFRDACGWEPNTATTNITKWLSANAHDIASVLPININQANIRVLDLSPSSLQAEQFNAVLAQAKKDGITLAVGKYNEARLIYSNQQYQLPGNDGNESRTIHLGIDLFVHAGTSVHAPLAGHVICIADNNQPQDYGPTLILKHTIAENLSFYTLYGHLNRATLTHLNVGDAIAKGDVIGWVGDQKVNGGWVPHLHLQIITDLFDQTNNSPGVAPASKRALWLSICPDANLIARIPTDYFPQNKWQKKTIQSVRQEHISNNVKLSYEEPLQIVRGKGQYLYDENGKAYLDCINNVSHVGHCHPKVVAAGQLQMAILNTNTRYLHENLAHYAQALAATLPAPLEVCFFVCSGSEANELALRLANAHTRRKNVLVIDNGYHGNTDKLINISPYKFNGPGGQGKPDFVQVLPMPDPLRDKTLPALPLLDSTLSAFIGESLLSCGGQTVLPKAYLQQIYAAVRKVGGVCIADEVQIGLGRIGNHFWGFQIQEVIPDIVTLGKPLGNGHPMGAVITTKEIADSFCNGMEYFNTFGGNPVSCAIGLSVLNVLHDEKLPANAAQVGNYLKQQLTELQKKYPQIADVRGMGLFLGIEFVKDIDTLAPAKDIAAYVVNRMKNRGILLSTDGPYQNIIKIKPPLVFTKENADFLTTNLEPILKSF